MLPASLGAPKGALPLYQSSTLHCRVYTGCSCSILRRVSYTASTTMHCTVGPKAYTGPLFCLTIEINGFKWFSNTSLGAPLAALPIIWTVTCYYLIPNTALHRTISHCTALYCLYYCHQWVFNGFATSLHHIFMVWMPPQPYYQSYIVYTGCCTTLTAFEA